jgi:hypothetical protein
MQYVIEENDEILVDETVYKFSFGDVIVCRNKRKIILGHRFFFKFWNFLLIAGDNCIRFELIKRCDYLGSVLLLKKSEGRVYNINKKSKKKTGYCVFMIVYMILMFLFSKNILSRLCYKYLQPWRNRLQNSYLESCRIN